MCQKFVVIAFLAVLPAVFSYSGGAPEAVCEDMTPKHPNPPQSAKTFPYKVSVSNNQIKSGEKVQITISGGEFKGFLLQVREGDKPIGSFNIPEESRYAKTISCSGRNPLPPSKRLHNAATHKNSATKKDLTLDWVAPRAASGKEYVVYVTVASDGEVYWVHQPTQAIKVV